MLGEDVHSGAVDEPTEASLCHVGSPSPPGVEAEGQLPEGRQQLFCWEALEHRLGLGLDDLVSLEPCNERRWRQAAGGKAAMLVGVKHMLDVLDALGLVGDEILESVGEDVQVGCGFAQDGRPLPDVLDAWGCNEDHDIGFLDIVGAGSKGRGSVKTRAPSFRTDGLRRVAVGGGGLIGGSVDVRHEEALAGVVRLLVGGDGRCRSLGQGSCVRCALPDWFSFEELKFLEKDEIDLIRLRMQSSGQASHPTK